MDWQCAVPRERLSEAGSRFKYNQSLFFVFGPCECQAVYFRASTVRHTQLGVVEKPIKPTPARPAPSTLQLARVMEQCGWRREARRGDGGVEARWKNLQRRISVQIYLL